MARYRPIHVKIWSDPDFENYTKDQKLIFLYLITNEHTTESGIYPVTPKTISQRTDIQMAAVEKAFQVGFKNVTYDQETGCVFIHNFIRYKSGGRPDLLEKSIQQDAKTTQTPLWALFITLYPEYDLTAIPYLNSIYNNTSIYIERFTNRLPTVCQPFKQSNKNNDLEEKTPLSEKPLKTAFSEYVFLTAEDFDRLKTQFGEAKTLKAIEILDNYIGAAPKNRNKYTDHNRVIRGWVMQEVEKQMPKGEQNAWSHLPRK